MKMIGEVRSFAATALAVCCTYVSEFTAVERAIGRAADYVRLWLCLFRDVCIRYVRRRHPYATNNA